MTSSPNESPAVPSDAFLSQLAHDLRNRLAPMKNAAHLLRKRAGNDEQAVWAVNLIDRQVDQLTQAIDALAEMTKLARAGVVVASAVFDLSLAIDAAVVATAAALEAREQKINRTGKREAVMLSGDRERIERSLRAMIVAAGKHSPAGTALELDCDCSGSEAVSLAIRPTRAAAGAAPKWAKAEAGELGVEVSLAQRIVALHLGSIAPSVDASGAIEFAVRLPRLAPGSA